MNRRHLLALLSIPGALGLAGCASGPEVRPAGRPRFEPPPQPADSIRLFVYRPQTLVGMAGRPFILVNGRRMGIAGSPVSENQNFLQPGSVFVVDAPAARAEVRWIQSGRNEPSPEAIVYAGQAGARRYLRWTLKATSGFLQEVDEAPAVQEIVPLMYSGYLNLLAR
ncbi:MAG: hypothetical protein JNM90_02860 [Burkholderiales bacterium]|nr:hypothetical protein [Burkholderiales bacterium]